KGFRRPFAFRAAAQVGHKYPTAPSSIFRRPPVILTSNITAKQKPRASWRHTLRGFGMAGYKQAV
ncbi:TPA: hypothetical protein ACFNMY_002142, partial [Neisseria bacilliformis]